MEDKKTVDIVNELYVCACSWEPQVRLLGNIQALELRKLCLDYAELRALCDELAKELQSTMNILTIATREERDQIKRSFAVLEQWRKDNE